MEYNVQFSSQNDKVSTDVNVQGGKTFALHLFKTGQTLEATMQSNEQELDASFSSMQVVGGGGSDGFSPIVDVEPIEGGHRLTVTDAQGTETADIMDGQDGISPVVSVEDIDGGHRVTITDKDGEKTFDVMDGKDGTGGSGGAAVQSDWAVNDESAPDYVKNRPFYSYVETTETETILASGTVTSVQTEYGVYAAPLTISNPPVGLYHDTFKVVIDGVEYSCLTANYYLAFYFIGNIAILSPVFESLGVAPPPDTGEPFVFMMGGEDPVETAMLATDITKSTTHEMSLVHVRQSTEDKDVKIPEKYYERGCGKVVIQDGHEKGEIFNDYNHNNAVGTYSHAEGQETVASGDFAHAEGFGAESHGDASHAEGRGATAFGFCSHAEGHDTVAQGTASHAEGYGTVASNRAQHVHGTYNIADDYDGTGYEEFLSGKYVHIVGNGTSLESLSNAHTLDWHGVPWYQGRPQFGGIEQDNGSQTVMANGDNEIILKSPNGSLWGIAVSDDGTLTVTAK